MFDFLGIKMEKRCLKWCGIFYMGLIKKKIEQEGKVRFGKRGLKLIQ